MGYNAFEILGLPSTATKEEVDQRYNELRSKYVNDRYKEGDEGEEAAEKLQQLEMAYRDICQQFADGSNSGDTAVTYEYIQQCTKENRLDEAQSLLDKISNRDAEWHYQQSIVFYKRNWFLESKKQLEYAVRWNLTTNAIPTAWKNSPNCWRQTRSTPISCAQPSVLWIRACLPAQETERALAMPVWTVCCVTPVATA